MSAELKKRRKSSNPKDPPASIHFHVPAFEVGSYGQDKNQDRKYFGLIEGITGGDCESVVCAATCSSCVECHIVSSISQSVTRSQLVPLLVAEMDMGILPLRGRMLELPGEAMPGGWEAKVVSSESGQLQSLRISLRHHSASSIPLETQKIEDKIVSILNPRKNRTKALGEQGVLGESECEN